MKRLVILIAACVLVAVSAVPVQGHAGETKEEFRAYWVDAFHDGFKTPEQVDQLMEDVRRSNANAVFVQVRRRGDAYFNKALEPRTEDPDLQTGFDALSYLLEKAHEESPRIEVHAWLATLPIWNSATPPAAENHVFNQHGPSAKGRDYWLMERADGVDRHGADYVLDPGHPDVVDYTVDQYVNVVRQYPVDGVHLDLVRYMGPEWGYNPTSLERYRMQTGESGIPDPQDEKWKAWRREQVDYLMRKVYLESIAVRPEVKVSAAVIAWGQGPSTLEEYRQSAPYTRVMQDWNGWLKEGIIDLAVPMNYDREHVPEQKKWYDQWIEWEKDHSYERHVAAGPGVYLNSVSGSLAQISRAQAPSEEGNRLSGVSLFSYAQTNKDGEPRDSLIRALTESSEYGEPVFPEPAIPPTMGWKKHPDKGHLMGRVTDSAGTPLDGATVELRGKGNRIDTLKTDGSGFFGVADLPAGHYTVKMKKGQGHGPARSIRVQSGQVTEADLHVIRP
ncbi:family 10 glycosylhydrolase [Paludifilum halophilum]|uniref:Glycosyl hydrolase-like 10 domain-containing protein n=1 Tax=Paludifilum halophilum TaxID=1642702 RepID=A0A235BC75_9BACL|nr:family 10 glycosylhydrolase [Paludifilum halophilum]OYD09886.1 hypothetical protein CHM34_02610 [Paludifilum halophilum]